MRWVAAIIALALVSCASKPERHPEMVWHGPTDGSADPQAFSRDRAECNAMAGPPPPASAHPPNADVDAMTRTFRIFEDCMMGRGWHLEPVPDASE